MKHTTRVQPFVAVTQKEANAIEMEKRVDDIIRRKDLDPNLRMRLYQDRLARLINFRKEYELKDEQSEPFVEPPPLIDFYSEPRQPYIDDFKVIQNYNYTPLHEKKQTFELPTAPPVESTPSRAPRPTLTPSLVWDDEQLGFSPTNNPTVKTATKKAGNKIDKKQTKQTVDREVRGLQQIPSYMMPTKSTRRGQGGTGFANRLYVRAWI